MGFCKAQGIVLQGYAPLGSADGVDQLLTHSTLVEIATARAKSPAEIALRWALSHGVALLPKSGKPERIAANAAPALFAAIGSGSGSGSGSAMEAGGSDWALSADEMGALDGIGDGGAQRFCWDPSEIQ